MTSETSGLTANCDALEWLQANLNDRLPGAGHLTAAFAMAAVAAADGRDALLAVSGGLAAAGEPRPVPALPHDPEQAADMAAEVAQRVAADLTAVQGSPADQVAAESAARYAAAVRDYLARPVHR